MGVLNESTIMGASGVVDSYTIGNSCRFNDDDSASMNRTFGTPTNAKIGTFSFWCKIGRATDTPSTIIEEPSANKFWVGFDNNNSGDYKLGIYLGNNSTKQVRNTTRLFRDHSAWYHIIISIDTTDGSASERLKLYVHGELVTDFTTNNTINQNIDVFTNAVHYIGSYAGGSEFFDGYLAEVNYIDGQALGSDSFGETGDYGEWKPIEYTGSYGNNGFYLDFADASDLGDDESGNGNDFSENNITASDQVTDSPTNNFAVLNALAKATNHTYSEGNLKATGASAQNRAMSTIGFDSGKWYYEVLVLTYGNTHPSIGVVTAHAENALNTTYTGSDAGGFGYYSGGINHNSSTNGGSYATYTGGDIIGIACDMDNLRVYFYKNGSNAITSGTAYETLVANTTYAFATSTNGSGVQVVNFGQDGTFAGNVTAGGNADGNGYGNFKYAPPSGFLALCSQNLPTPAVIPSEHFSTVTYTGDGSQDVTGVGFQPDLVWCKTRDDTYHFQLHDSVRGATAGMLNSNQSAAENSTYQFDSFDSDGFTTDSGNVTGINASGDPQVAWCWKANGSGSSNEDGSINTTSTSANTLAGISISTYTGTGSNATVGHGLSKAPELVIVKRRDSTSGWPVGSIQPVGSMDFTDFVRLDVQDAVFDNATIWNDTAPTSSVFSLGNNIDLNASSGTYIAYCFHSVEGFSRIGMYAGNGSSSDGTFVYTGFRPSWICLKRIDGVSNWRAHTSGNRTPPDVNGVFARLEPSGNGSEATSTSSGDLDFLSNGFKIKDGTAHVGASGNEYLYIAFAKTPFSHSNAV